MNRIPMPQQPPPGSAWAGQAPIDVHPVGRVVLRVELLKLHQLVLVLTHAMWIDPVDGQERQFVHQAIEVFPVVSMAPDPLADMGDRTIKTMLLELPAIIQADHHQVERAAAAASAPPS